MKIKTGVLIVSERCSGGKVVEQNQNIIEEILGAIDGEVVDCKVIPEDVNEIIWELRRLADYVQVDLILTSGGTGISTHDVTPEATVAVLEKRIPGLEETMRQEWMKTTPKAMLSRTVAGYRGKTLIVNLPGKPDGIRESLKAILPAIPQAVKILKGKTRF